MGTVLNDTESYICHPFLILIRIKHQTHRNLGSTSKSNQPASFKTCQHHRGQRKPRPCPYLKRLTRQDHQIQNRMRSGSAPGKYATNSILGSPKKLNYRLQSGGSIPCYQASLVLQLYCDHKISYLCPQKMLTRMIMAQHCVLSDSKPRQYL